MLDAIADFWKPVKRLQAQMRMKPEELQVGSRIVFGFVPQPSLSGRTLAITAINTYKFGSDILTSFVLSQERDAGASMIIAETGGEQYIAVSRRISISDRNKLFTHEEIEEVARNPEMLELNVRDITPEYKGWVAPHYTRDLYGVRGQLYKGDHRSGLIAGEGAIDFAYSLMVSDNNDHALEVERYEDGRIEVYATVYRRVSDVSEVVHPAVREGVRENARPEVRLVSSGDKAPAIAAPAKPEPRLETSFDTPAMPPVSKDEPVMQQVVDTPQEEPQQADIQHGIVTMPVNLPEFLPENVVKKEVETPEPMPQPKAEQATERVAENMMARAAVISATLLPASDQPLIINSHNQPYIQQEIKAVNKEPSNFVNESIDCELHVANKIIDEAIRQEMRINDVVRRVIGLPVSQQESVQIPVTLTDQDYALLAIRYGISASDHEAIKRRIIEDLADFSGANKVRKAA